MNEYKLKLLEFVSKNYDNVVKPAQGGEYIEIDLIPGSHDGLHNLGEMSEYMDKEGIDPYMFTRSYKSNDGDGIRMGRYWYFMQKTTAEILSDLKTINP
jgi:hypothetical protein